MFVNTMYKKVMSSGDLAAAQIHAFMKKAPLPEAEKCVVDANLQGANETENRQLAYIINEMCKSEAGREVIQTALKNDFQFIFDRSMPNVYGYADPENKLCAMNPAFTVEDLIATMAHELRHVKQFDEPIVQECGDLTKVDANTYYKCLRAMEADASAQECLVSWQLKEQGLPGAWNNFERDFPELAEPFKAEMANSKGPEDIETLKKARTAVFLGWYENGPRRDGYDTDYAQMMAQAAGTGELLEVLPAELKRANAADMIPSICQENGNVYFAKDPAMLDTEHYTGVSATTKMWLEFAFTKYEAVHGEGSSHVSEIPVIDLSRNSARPRALSLEARTAALAVKQEQAADLIHASSNRRDMAPMMVKHLLAARNR